MYINLIFIVVLLGPIIYILATLGGQQSSTFEDFYFAQRKVSPDKFVSSTVMYSLQVAALTLFATWGYMYGLWVIVVPVFWGVGYIVIVAMIKKGTLDEFLKAEDAGTIHQFIGKKNNAKSVAALAALCSLIGITGPALFEAEFVGGLISTLVVHASTTAPNPQLIDKYSDLFFFGFIVFTAVYMLYGGFRALVRTDEIQLGIGFCFFAIFLSMLLFNIAVLGHLVAAITLAVIAVTLCLCVIASYVLTSVNIKHSHSFYPVLVALFSFLICIIFSFLYGKNDPSGIVDVFDALKLDQPFALGGMSIFSLLIANIMYQVVDVGQWQRLLSVKYDVEKFNAHKAIVAESLARTGLYSSVSWIFAILLGVSLHFISADIASNVYNELPTMLLDFQSNHGYFGQVLVLVFLFAIVAIAMSTLDSLVSSITFTIHNDWLISFSKKLKSQYVARIATVCYFILAISAYRWLTDKVGSFADILYCCWAFQIALLPTIVGALRNHPASAFISFTSILLGGTGALIPLFVESLDPYQYAPPLALLLSTSAYILGRMIFAWLLKEREPNAG